MGNRGGRLQIFFLSFHYGPCPRPRASKESFPLPLQVTPSPDIAVCRPRILSFPTFEAPPAKSKAAVAPTNRSKLPERDLRAKQGIPTATSLNLEFGVQGGNLDVKST